VTLEIGIIPKSINRCGFDYMKSFFIPTLTHWQNKLNATGRAYYGRTMLDGNRSPNSIEYGLRMCDVVACPDAMYSLLQLE
jgi:hypothetical protein